ncbi:MAG TPA: hypothetical protein VF384_03380 [Planctomycetota bacterium]
MRFVALAAVVVFTPLAIWLANQSPPRVTHKEALALALAIEQANDDRALASLVHFEDVQGAPADSHHRPGDTSPQLASQILFAKGRGQYTFLEMKADAAGETTLRFRCERGGMALDYHELKLERHEDRIVVCELWSMRLGGWTRELLQQRREILGSTELATEAGNFLRQVDVLEPEPLEAAFQGLPRKLRTSPFIALQYLAKMGLKNFLPFRVALAEFRSENPDHLGPDLLLISARSVEVPQPEILGAFRRIHARIGDEPFLARWRAALVK